MKNKMLILCFFTHLNISRMRKLVNFIFSPLIVALILLISLIGVFGIHPNVISANRSLAESKFLVHFSNHENSFYAVYALSLISYKQREAICGQFTTDKNIRSSLVSFIAYVDTDSLEIESETEIPHFPAFVCTCNTSTDVFYVTYSKDDEFFKLDPIKFEYKISNLIFDNHTGQSEFKNVSIEISSSKLINLDGELLDNVPEKVFKYFKSSNYANTGRRVMQKLISEGKWPYLCRKFDPDFEYSPRANENEMNVLIGVSSYIGEHSIFGQTIACSGDTDTFFVTYYIGSFFYKTNYVKGIYRPLQYVWFY